MKKIHIIILLLTIIVFSYSQDIDSCADVTKKYDPFKEDSIIQTKNEKLGKKLSYKFLIEPKNQISLYFQFTTYNPGIIYEGEIFYLYLADNSVIELKLTEDSYPGIMGKHLRSYSFEFELKSKEIQKLINSPVVETKISDYDFPDLNNQKQFIRNLYCIISYLK